MNRLKQLLAAAMLVLLIPGPAFGIDTEDKHAILYDTNFYSATDQSCGTDTTTTLSGNDNIEKGYNYFVQKSLTPQQSAGIIGNFMQESGMDPTAVQPGGPGRGIAQWSVGDRWDKFLAFKPAGSAATDLGAQLDFAWHELTSSYSSALSALKGTTSVDDATTVFEQKYEAAGTPNMPNRISYAKQVLSKYGGGASASGSSPTASDTCGGGLGVDGNFIFPERTTQIALTSHDPHWCYTSQTSCHHDYFAADIFNDEGTTNVAATSGTVIKAVDTSCHGGYDVPRVQIKGDDGKYYYYTHMKPGSIKVHDGQNVEAGTELGVIGPTECAENTSSHLHFQMSSVPIQSTEDPVERTKYINPQPNLVSAFKKLPAR